MYCGRHIQVNCASMVVIRMYGSPCKANCLNALNHAKDLARERFFAMTRLDENRAKSQLAKKAGVEITAVSNLAVWGNHSATQYPDFYNARINAQPVPQKIADEAWLKGEFISTVQPRAR